MPTIVSNKMRHIRIKSKRENEINNFRKQNTEALKKRIPKPIIQPVTQPVTPVGPWTDKEIYNPNGGNVATGPDLAPLIERLKNEYPIVSQTEKYKEVFKKTNPLVSIIITTYNEVNSLINIALKSILNQTYKNLQIIVIADHSIDNTDLEMSKIKDDRIIYQNLPERTVYPGKTNRDIWLVAGTVPHNIGLSLATGDFITYCDQDDFFTLDKVEKLVSFSQDNECDFIHHPFNVCVGGKIASSNASNILACGYVTTSSIFHHKWFKQIPVDINCWKIDEPGDWNKCKKFIEIGAKIVRHPETLSSLSK